MVDNMAGRGGAGGQSYIGPVTRARLAGLPVDGSEHLTDSPAPTCPECGGLRTEPRQVREFSLAWHGFLGTFAALVAVMVALAVPVTLGWHRFGPVATADLVAVAVELVVVNAGFFVACRRSGRL